MSGSGDGMVALLVGGLILYSCTGSEESTDALNEGASYSFAGTSDDEEVATREPFDEDAAREAAEDEVSSESYSIIGSPYGCTIDCFGHDAGFAWAAEGNEDGGVSNSQSFDEGQQAYAEAVDERVEEMRGDYEAGQDRDY